MILITLSLMLMSSQKLSAEEFGQEAKFIALREVSLTILIITSPSMSMLA
jgi:hypothetical protein